MPGAYLTPMLDLKHGKSMMMERQAALKLSVVPLKLSMGRLKLLGACKRRSAADGSGEGCERSVPGAYLTPMLDLAK